MDFAHPAPAERREYLVGADLRPRDRSSHRDSQSIAERLGGPRASRNVDGRRLDEAVTRNITSEQPCDFAAQGFIPSAGFVEESITRIRLAFERRVIQPFDLFPAVRLHNLAPRSVSDAATIGPAASRA